MLTKKDSSILYIYSMFLVLCFVFKSTFQIASDIVVFHISANQLYAALLISSIFIVFNLFNSRIDSVTILLSMSAILGLIPLLYAKNTSHYLGNYAPLLISLAVYFICLQNKEDISDSFFKSILAFSVVISLQVIYTEWVYFSSLSFANFNNSLIKGSMDIPVGSSNAIATMLLPMMVFIVTYKRNWTIYSILALNLYALILCRSKNALILLLLLMAFVPMVKLSRRIAKDKSVGAVGKLVAVVILLALFGTVFNLIVDIGNFLITDLSFNFTSSFANPFLRWLDELSSGRVTVFASELERFGEHILFGNGFGYEIGQTKSHNWILDLMVQKGIIGVFFYFISIGIVVKTGWRHREDVFVRAAIFAILVIHVQGLLEISVFTAKIDFLIWSMAGLMMSRIKREQLNQNAK